MGRESESSLFPPRKQCPRQDQNKKVLLARRQVVFSSGFLIGIGICWESQATHLFWAKNSLFVSKKEVGTP